MSNSAVMDDEALELLLENLFFKKNFINWGIDMHNEVNRVYGKKIYSYEEGLKNILDGSKPIKCTGNMDEFTTLLESFDDNKNYEKYRSILNNEK